MTNSAPSQPIFKQPIFKWLDSQKFSVDAPRPQRAARDMKREPFLRGHRGRDIGECEWRLGLYERGYRATTPRNSGRFAVRSAVEHDFCVVAAPHAQKVVPSGRDLAVFGDLPSLLLGSN